MSPLSQSLEKRIQELKASIEAQKTELAAYEHVLHMETTKGSSPVKTSEVQEALVAAASQHTATKKQASKKAFKKTTAAASAPQATTTANSDAASVAFTGNKTALVAEIVKSYGSTGASPKDVDGHFSGRNIERSKNLIYNTLSYLVAQKKLARRDGKYFAMAGGSAAPAKKKAGAEPAPEKTGTKRRLSPEGLKRIKEALKKRWAAKHAAEATAAKKK